MLSAISVQSISSISNPGTETFKRMDNFYSKVLIPYVDNLIRQYMTKGKDGFSFFFCDLPDFEIQKITALFIEYDQCDLFSITQNNHYDEIITSLLQMLRDDDLDNKLSFADTIKNRLSDYYKPQMQELFRDRLEWIEDESRNDREFITYHHYDNGEIYRVAR